MKDLLAELFESVLKKKSTLQIDHLALSGVVQSRRSVSLFQGKVDSAEISDEIKVGVWVGSKGSWGTASLEAVSECAILEAVTAAREASRFNDPEPDFSLANVPSQKDERQTHVPDSSILKITMGEMELRASEIEERAKKFSPKIKNIPQTSFGTHSQRRIFANSNGIRFEECRNFADASLSVMAAGQDGRMVNVHEAAYFSRADLFDPSGLVKEVANEAVLRIEPRGLQNGRYACFFDRRSAAQLLASFSPVFSGDLLYRNLTRLGGRLGQVIASNVVSINDTGRSGLMPHLYDAEGSPASETMILHEGVLENFLHNRFTSKKAGGQTTGNASGGLDSLPNVSTANISWCGKTTPEAEILSSIKEGILIKELHGASASPISGDFSFGALGYWVEGGRVSHPVADFTVAGNFFDLLMSVEGIGKELEFFSPHLMGSTGGRALLVSPLSLSGGY